MEEKGLELFKFEDKQVRVVEVNGEPWVVAKDVLLGLEYSNETVKNTHKNLAHVPDEWKGRYPITTPGGTQDITCLSEQGMYFFLARSDKPKALPFQKWIAGEVIPSIRKTGIYATVATVDKILADPTALLSIVQNWKAERDRSLALASQVTALETQIQEDEHKVAFADMVSACDGNISIGSYAKSLDYSGDILGRNRLFKWLRGHKYVMYDHKVNVPTYKSIKSRWLQLAEGHFGEENYGINSLARITLVTPKGQLYFTKKLLVDFPELKLNKKAGN